MWKCQYGFTDTPHFSRYFSRWTGFPQLDGGKSIDYPTFGVVQKAEVYSTPNKITLTAFQAAFPSAICCNCFFY